MTNRVCLLVGLLVFAVIRCPAQPQPQKSIPPPESSNPALVKAYSQVTTQIRQKTSVPLRLPAYVGGLEGETDLFAIVKAADKTGYIVVLGATPDCQGEHVCSYGTFLGTTRPTRQLDEYDLTGRSGSPVLLRGGIKANFYDTVCGAYCSDSLIAWTEGNNHYIIGLKAEKKSRLIRAANSALQAATTAQN